jgi:2-C-methyl-D-erythritol 2,4-cyclodiphosphate synthase
MRIGIGYDVHKLVENRPLILGGVHIPHDKGLEGHSDADVLIHAIMDSILGACGEGDIGRHFPNTDEKYLGISSLKLLASTKRIMESKCFQIQNIDAVIIAQKPRLSPFLNTMKNNIALVLGSLPDQINIKATTTETLGFEGREEGIAAQAVCLLMKK